MWSSTRESTRGSKVWEPVRLTLVAFRFLTRIPLPDVWVEGADLRRASAAFPLVGLVVAGVGIGVRAALGPLFGGATATVAALGAMVALTGALHEDGLADTADGLWGGHDPEQRVAIMRDSRIGTYGIVALLTVAGLRVSLLLPLGVVPFARAVACGQVLGRASTLLLVRLLPVAAPATANGNPNGKRLGEAVAGALSPRGVAAAVMAVAGTLLAAAGRWAPLPLAAALLTSLLCAWLFRRRLGGFTGDTLGAASQLADLAAVATIVALQRAALL